MAFDNVMTINSFSEIRFSDFSKQIKNRIKDEIEYKGKEYILGVDEEEFKAFIINKYTFEPLLIDCDNPEIGQPDIKKEMIRGEYSGERNESDVYTFTIYYKFSGSAEIFRIYPSSYMMDSAQITVNGSRNTVSFSFKVYNLNPTEFNDNKNRFFQSAFGNVTNANNDIINWNQALPVFVNKLFYDQKDKYLKENDFFAAINLKVNPNTTSVFVSPVIKKKEIPQPIVSTDKEFSSEPTLSNKIYIDILKVIFDSGKNMEKKPSLYQGKDEEGLRDQFLFILETRYEGTTATGETFNKSGKTDIILKFAKDGSNLFVAECKFWHGGSEFINAISQLFDRYLTWRDSKVALIVFVKNHDFSNVLSTIQAEIKNHSYFIRENGNRGESSFSYIMHLPQDNEKQIFLEVLAFHYDKK